jgi:hypothetical protein
MSERIGAFDHQRFRPPLTRRKLVVVVRRCRGDLEVRETFASRRCGRHRSGSRGGNDRGHRRDGIDGRRVRTRRWHCQDVHRKRTGRADVVRERPGHARDGLPSRRNGRPRCDRPHDGSTRNVHLSRPGIRPRPIRERRGFRWKRHQADGDVRRPAPRHLQVGLGKQRQEGCRAEERADERERPSRSLRKAEVGMKQRLRSHGSMVPSRAATRYR